MEKKNKKWLKKQKIEKQKRERNLPQ